MEELNYLAEEELACRVVTDFGTFEWDSERDRELIHLEIPNDEIFTLKE